MASHLPEHATQFRDRFAYVEHLLRRAGYIQKRNSQWASVDWMRFADELGEPFLVHARGSGHADTLINGPPRRLDVDLKWQPTTQQPIEDVVGLFLRGVCQVRNNIVHGEKYIDAHDPRDDALVVGAAWVLEEAIERHPQAAQIFASLLEEADSKSDRSL